MQMLQLKDVADKLGLHYSTVYAQKEKLGFIQLTRKGKWLVDEKVLAQNMNKLNNAQRLAPNASAKGGNKWRSKRSANTGTCSLQRRTVQELEKLLGLQ